MLGHTKSSPYNTSQYENTCCFQNNSICINNLLTYCISSYLFKAKVFPQQIFTPQPEPGWITTKPPSAWSHTLSLSAFPSASSSYTSVAPSHNDSTTYAHEHTALRSGMPLRQQQDASTWQRITPLQHNALPVWAGQTCFKPLMTKCYSATAATMFCHCHNKSLQARCARFCAQSI